MLIQLPSDAERLGYKQTRPFHHAQIFHSPSHRRSNNRYLHIPTPLAPITMISVKPELQPDIHPPLYLIQHHPAPNRLAIEELSSQHFSRSCSHVFSRNN